MFVLLITRTNQTSNVRLVSIVCMQGSLGKPTYPSNLKITLIINKDASLAFGKHVDYSARRSLEERKGSEC